MKIAFECIPCMIRQAIEVAQELTDDTDKQKEIITRSLKEISNIDFDETAPVVSRLIHNHAKEVANNPDPYKELKHNHNFIAEEICKDFNLNRIIDESADPLETACKLSIAGNIIDMGAYTVVERHFIEAAVQSSLKDSLDPYILDQLKIKMDSAKKVLFLADNAGEIVFDKLLINRLDNSKITYVVKGGPIVNDATSVDARESGIDKIVRVIDTGVDCQGTPLNICSEDFIREYESADFIISKGQANYETLSETDNKDIFYLLKAKCPSIASDIGCDQGKTVLIYNK